MTSLSSTGGWMTGYTTCFARKVIMTSQANTTNGNVARLDSSNFPTFTSEKYLYGTYRRKIINIYCPLVTEKSTNPCVKTCPCLGKPRHGLSKFDTRVSWFLSHHRTIEVDSISLLFGSIIMTLQYIRLIRCQKVSSYRQCHGYHMKCYYYSKEKLYLKSVYCKHADIRPRISIIWRCMHGHE